MKDIIFAFPSSCTDIETPLLISSIRKFAGKFSNSPIWVVTTKKNIEIPSKMVDFFNSMNVQVVYLNERSDIMKLPFIGFTQCAAKAESLAKGKTKFLVWLGSNSLVINEPKEFLLADGINLGFRPVHHTLIGSLYDKPLDSFWEMIYKKCKVDGSKVFPMKTHVDGNTLRPYINSGFLIVRPEKQFLQTWAERYKNMIYDEEIEEFFRKDELYAIFTHQAVLSSLFLTEFEKEEIFQLPFEYCYPIHLFHESLEVLQPDSINQMITMRLYIDKLLNPEWRESVPIEEPLKSWLDNKLEEYSELVK
ncbi:MAG: histidine phosphatase family protein [Candidatus Heimdallarchaeota archaeon]|nr:histidine phosphatase family protein [Candidatus Heimdallarchaeota archaeon]MBY8994497.1 histidine phosphatase family protein [Candidatus Heimdallarchaeota archaeon]